MFPQQTKFQAFSLSNVIHQPTHVNILFGKYFVISLIMNYLVLFKGYIYYYVINNFTKNRINERI